MIGEAGDLRQMGDAQHLIGGRELLEPPADAFGRPAANAGINFVDYQQAFELAWQRRAARLRVQGALFNGLAKRLEHISARDVAIGISGGLDSTLALVVTCKTFDLLGLPRTKINALTMPGF
ncbi:MAG: hypothetical protein HYR60_08870, partial [Acidobacteria bacterium]|nr:hypothetical protein [Acidobacteriota bacterium]